jgi:hypothetical protein
VVVDSSRYQYMMTNDVGVVGWFVPVAVHAEMMEAVRYYVETEGDSTRRRRR